MKKRRVFFIVVLVFVLESAGFSLFRFIKRAHEAKIDDSKYLITEVVQTGLQKRALPTLYLTELLELSYDKPINYFAFDEESAREKLLKSPVIKEAKVLKKPPNKVYIDYESRYPIAELIEFTNCAIDEEGEVFPLHPFYPDLKLTEFVLGESIKGFNEARRIQKILRNTDLKGTFIRRIDTSKIDHKSYGKREIVLIIDGKRVEHYLRLPPVLYEKEIGNYLAMREKLVKEELEGTCKVIDLRIENIAYVEDVPLCTN